MGEFQSLLLVLAAIYLAECFVWIRRGALAFVRWWRADCAIGPSSPVLSNPHGSLTVANPMPPLGVVYLNAPWPCSVSAEAVYAYSSQCLASGERASHTGRFVRFDEGKSFDTDGRRVRVNEELLLKANSPQAARHLAQTLRRWQKTPATERAEAIQQWMADSLDVKQVRERVQQCHDRSRAIRLLSNSLFVSLFAFAPLLVWRFGLAQIVWPLLAGMLAHTVTIALLFQRAHKALYPDGGEERFTPFLTMLLAPPTAIRASDILSRHLLEPCHPLAVANVLCAAGRFENFARQVLMDLQHPLLPVCPASESGPVATEQWFRSTHLAVAGEFVARAGLDLGELMRPPERAEPGNLSYCPRCHAQFVTKESVCEDCGGRALASFPPEPQTGARATTPSRKAQRD